MLSSFRSSPLYLKVNSFYPPKLQLILFLATFISTSQALPTTTTAATFPAPSTLFSFSALTTTTTTTNTTNTTISPSSPPQLLNSTTITSTTSTPSLNSTNFTTTTTTTSFSSSSPLPTLITPENSRVNDEEEEKEGHSLPPDMGINKELEDQMEKSDDGDDDVVNATFSCQCPIGYALAYSRKKCLRLVCETDYDCNRHMSVEVLACASKKCVCRQHMHTSEDGFSCETDGELFVGIFVSFALIYAICFLILGVVICKKCDEKPPAPEPKKTSPSPPAAKKKKEKKDKTKKKKEKKKEKTKKKTEKEKKKKKKQSTECKAVVAAEEAVAEVTENS